MRSTITVNPAMRLRNVGENPKFPGKTEVEAFPTVDIFSAMTISRCSRKQSELNSIKAKGQTFYLERGISAFKKLSSQLASAPGAVRTPN